MFLSELSMRMGILGYILVLRLGYLSFFASASQVNDSGDSILVCPYTFEVSRIVSRSMRINATDGGPTSPG